MARAQASTEFIIVMGVSLIVLLVFFTLALDFFFSVRSQRDYSDALSAVQTLAAEADSVYSQGEGAEKIVAITIPSTANFSPNETFIGRPLNSVLGKSNTISISLGGTVVSATTKAPVSGSFPSYYGVHQMRVASHGNFVSIGTHLVSATPGSIYATALRSSQKTAAVTFKVALSQSTNDSVNVTLSSPWNHTNVQLAITPSSFSSFGIGDVPVLLTFNTTAGAVGIYTSSLNVSAVRQSPDGSASARESFYIPITLDVSSG
ncbi:MAG: hypothetical protein WC717_04865 [Candidatus Micrarchaeia archaeon]|jgi:uncharacterized protein (UPF0333 family)